jgi:DHA1 family multidrug resistance protein-like MFS transporter
MLAIAFFVGAMGFVQTPTQLLALRLGQGLFSGFIPPSITLVSIAAPADRQGRVAGNLATALAVGGLIGPMFGGFIATLLGSRQSVFFVVGGLALISAIVVWFGAEEDASMRQRREDAPRGVKATLAQTGRDIGDVLANPALRATALVVFALQFGLGSVNPVIELHVQSMFAGAELEGTLWETLTGFFASEGTSLDQRVQTLATSLLFGVMAIANLLSLSAWGHYGDRVGHRRALLHCAILCVVALALQAATAYYSVLLAGRFVMGVAMAGIGPLAFGLAAGQASQERRGGAFGVVFSARTFAVAVGGTVGGFLNPYIGIRGVMVLSGILLVGTVVLYRESKQPAA